MATAEIGVQPYRDDLTSAHSWCVTSCRMNWSSKQRSIATIADRSGDESLQPNAFQSAMSEMASGSAWRLVAKRRFGSPPSTSLSSVRHRTQLAPRKGRQGCWLSVLPLDNIIARLHPKRTPEVISKNEDVKQAIDLIGAPDRT